jgi:hypothetical protein
MQRGYLTSYELRHLENAFRRAMYNVTQMAVTGDEHGEPRHEAV